MTQKALGPAMIKAVKADYKSQVVVITVEVGLSEDTLKTLTPFIAAAQYGSPVEISVSNIQQMLPL